jgi:hypothetical protein
LILDFGFWISSISVERLCNKVKHAEIYAGIKTMNEREKLREWVQRWDETGEILEKISRREIRISNLAETIPLFDSAFRAALLLEPAKPDTGLIEFQKILKKLR